MNNETKHTPAWKLGRRTKTKQYINGGGWNEMIRVIVRMRGEASDDPEGVVNLNLVLAAPSMHDEMIRFLPVLERAIADSKVWEMVTAGTGIATLNRYRAAIAKATGAA